MKRNFILGTALLLLTACSNISDVRKGMTEDEVEEMLGKANSTSNRISTTTVNGKNTIQSESTWIYNGKGTVKFRNGKVTKTGK